jgi:hypothetical protein
MSTKTIVCAISFVVLYVVLMTWMKYLSASNRLRAHRGEFEECPFGSFQTMKEVSRVGKRPNRSGILSFSLFGNHTSATFQSRYWSTLLKTLDANNIPSFQPMVFIDLKFPEDMRQILLQKGCEVVTMDSISYGYEGALWRFLAIETGEPTVCADADQFITKSWAKNVQKWLDSDKSFMQVMTLSPASLRFHMTAGEFGVQHFPELARTIREKIKNYCLTEYGSDENFLVREVKPYLTSKNTYRVYIWSRSVIYPLLFFALPVAVLYVLLVGVLEYVRPPHQSTKLWLVILGITIVHFVTYLVIKEPSKVLRDLENNFM